MTDRKQALMDLLDKVEWGECPHWQDAGKAIGINPDDRHLRVMGAYNGSLNAAKALHEAVLPDFFWQRTGFVMTVTDDHTGWGNGIYGSARDDNNPARAWLIAIIKALIDKETTQ